MINTQGIIQNNKTASDFIKKQRKFNQVYKVLDKESERKMIEQYARLVTDESGKPRWNDDFECDFEWIGDETELREKLQLHNLQAVTKVSTKHCQNTRDYDDMYAKGLYGLARAANMFHPFKLITKVVGYNVDENGKKTPIFEPKLDENGNYSFVKFITFAQTWIFKYIVDEFYAKSIVLDNNSISMNEIARIKGVESRNFTLENFIQDHIIADVEPPKSAADEISTNEVSDIYSGLYGELRDYVRTSSELSTIERQVLEATHFGPDAQSFVKRDGKTNIKKLSSVLKIPQRELLEAEMSALSKLKEHLQDEYGYDSMACIA